MNKWGVAPVVAAKPVARAAAKAVGAIAIIRRQELGNNCKFIIDGLKGLGINADILIPAKAPVGLKWAIRWGTTTPIDKNTNVINFASAITETSDKGTFRLKAAKDGLTPKTWGSLQELANDDVGAEQVIIRPRHHERSENINLCINLEQAEKAIKKINGPYYISEYVKKDQEFRVFVANGRAFMVFEKKPKKRNDVSWGCVEEGAMEYVNWSEWPVHVVENAIKAFNLSKLHFGAVDVIVKDGKAYFLEINTAPEVWPYYGERFADVISWMINGDKRKTIPVKNWKDWKNLIHPAITKNAIV